jgi:glutamyl-tRNA synthetase
MTETAGRVRVRFAPSPTGRLHIGNIRTALFNWLFARRAGGEFMLRLDDTDAERSTEAYARGIRDDLRWLGLTWDLEARQSDRYVAYEAATRRLTETGRLYACFETEDELERKRKKQLSRGQPPVYDRASLDLTDADRDRLLAEGRRPYWRFRLDHRRVGWHDLVRGEQSIDTASLSDPVMIRQGGGYLYTLPSVVDDIDFAISHVIRGEDHVANTAVQIQLFEALGATPPAFAHHNLLVGADGEALSKRRGALSIHGLREAGIEPMAILSHAATIGSSHAVAAYQHIDELVMLLDFHKLSRAPARFDEAELRLVNARLLHGMEYGQVAARLKKLKVGGGEAFWLAVRGNVELVDDVRDWWQVVHGRLAPEIADPDFCRTALQLLPPAPLDEASWPKWTEALKVATGRKGKELFMPLRLALTGRSHGPEMKLLLPLIGHDKAAARLEGRIA